MDALPSPSEDVIAEGVQAVAARAGASPTTIRHMAAQLLADEGLGNSPAETWAAIQEVANYVDEAPHTRSLSDRAWEAGTEVDRLGRKAEAMTRGRRYA
jgi:hypothetical protein